MTEWNAAGYSRQSALQKWVADEHLASLTLADGERVLDVLDTYAQVSDDAGPNVFVFYQMEVELRFAPEPRDDGAPRRLSSGGRDGSWTRCYTRAASRRVCMDTGLAGKIAMMSGASKGRHDAHDFLRTVEAGMEERA